MAVEATQKERKLKVLLMAGLLAVVLLGLLAWCAPKTDDGEVPPRPAQPDAPPTVQLDADEAWDTEDLLLALDDTVTTEAALVNRGNSPISQAFLTAQASSSPGEAAELDPAEVMLVTITTAEGRVVAKNLPLDQLDRVALLEGEAALEPGAYVELTFKYHFKFPASEHPFAGSREDYVANAANQLQGATLSVVYLVESAR